jgi:hypothetical protein
MTDVEARLADWLRDLDLQPAADRQQAITAAARGLCDGASLGELLDLVVVAHDGADADAGARIENALRSEDSTWSVRADDAAARRTAAVAVAMAMEGEPKAAVAAALGVRSAAFLGMTPVVADLVPIAGAALKRASEALRGRSELAAATSDIKGAFKSVPTMNEGEAALTDQVTAVAKAAQTAAARAAGVTRDSLPAVTQRFKALEEEVDLLWLLIGDYSDRAQRTFEKLQEAAAPCILALDFGDLVQFLCPPRATRALLSRALGPRSSQTVTLGGAVGATIEVIGTDWIRADVDNHTLMPVLSAAHEHHEFGGKDAWIESVARWNIDPAQESTALELAEQLLGERVLADLLQ